MFSCSQNVQRYFYAVFGPREANIYLSVLVERNDLLVSESCHYVKVLDQIDVTLTAKPFTEIFIAPKQEVIQFVENFIKANKSNRLAYEKLISINQTHPSKSQEKCLVDCNFQGLKITDYNVAYKLPFRCTKITKLLVFQFKLLHRRLATNYFLKKQESEKTMSVPFVELRKRLLSNCSGYVARLLAFRRVLRSGQENIKSC